MPEPEPDQDKLVPVPSVRRIRQSMVDNDLHRQAVRWGTADFSRLSSKQVDAVHRVVSSLLYAESHGNEVCGNLIRRIPYSEITDAFAVQILDESHHTRLLTRYVLAEMRRPILRPPLIAWLTVKHLQHVGDPLVCAMGAGYFVECAAAEVQWELIHNVEEPLLAEVFNVILRDESRHQALGREATVFLLDQAPYREGWKRARARMYRHFLAYYSRVTLNHYAECAKVFGIDLARIHKRTLDKVAAALPL